MGGWSAMGCVTIRILLVFLVAARAVLACSWDYPIWIPRSKDADPLYRFIRDGTAGYIDQTGNVVIEPRFRASGNEFHAGLLETGNSDGEYLNRQGKRAFDKKFYRGWAFSEGLAVALENEDGLWGYIDTAGEFAISPRFKGHPHGYVSSFSDGLARVEVDGKYGYIGKTGKFVIEPRFLAAEHFVEGMARVVVVDEPCWHAGDGPCATVQVLPEEAPVTEGLPPACKYTFVNKSGHLLPARFDRLKDFAEGMAPVRIDREWGYIDSAGEIVIKPSFDDAWPFSGGLARVIVRDKFGFIDASGESVIPPIYDWAKDFSNGLAPVEQKGYYFIDKDAWQAFPGRFAEASPFFKGLAHVQLFDIGGDSLSEVSQKFAYINTSGKVVFSYDKSWE